MRVLILAVFDSKAAVFSQPFFAQSSLSGLRAFGDAARDKQHHYGQHPEDYSLFHIGFWDDVKGEVEPLAQNVNLGLAAQLIVDSDRR